MYLQKEKNSHTNSINTNVALNLMAADTGLLLILIKG